jgi:hypothetical protein
MAKVSLGVATAIDLAIAVLLVAVSGFLFGTGPESLRASGAVEVLYAAGIMACVAAPVAGFILNGSGRVGPAQFVAWLPVLGALAALVLPVPY